MPGASGSWGGGASGSWRQRKSFAEWWDQDSQINNSIVKPIISALTLPGDVYAGRVDPRSDEAIGRAFDLAGTMTLGAGAVPAGANELRAGVRAYHGTTKEAAKAIGERGFAVPGGREPAVFLSDEPLDAYEFASMRAGLDPRRAKVLRAEVDPSGFHEIDAGGEMYNPEMMAGFLREAKQAGAPGVVVRDIQNFEHRPPSTSYVVFDDSLISILRKYGVIGPVAAALGLSQAVPDQAQAGQ